MELDGLKKTWQNRPMDVLPERPADEMVSSIKARLKKLNRTVFWRDVMEIGCSLGLILFFGKMIWAVRGATSRIGAAVIIAGLILIIAKLRGARRKEKKNEPAVSLKEFLSAERAGIDAQIRLLRSVLWWYIGPPILGANLFFVGTRGLSLASLGYLIATLTLAAFIYWLNLTAVKKKLLPLREELDRLLHGLETGGDDTHQESNS